MSSLEEKRSSSGEFPSETDFSTIARERVSGFTVRQIAIALASSTFAGPASPGLSLSVSILMAPMICAAFPGSVTAFPARTTWCKNATVSVGSIPVFGN